jgi:GTP-binding protein
LTTRKSLKKVFLLIDISIPPQKIDKEMIETLVAENIKFAIIFTKTDKASQKQQHITTKEYTTFLKKICSVLPHLFFMSNISGKGRDELLNHIEEMLPEKT